MAVEAADAGLRADQRGSIFPALDGGDPGSQETGEDISGRPLPPMTPEAEDMPRAAGTGSNISSVPAVLEGAPAPEGVQVAGGEIEAPTGRKPRTAQERIAQLTRRYRQEQESRSGVESQLQQTLNLIQQQQQEIMALRNGQAPARNKANEAADALGLAGVPSETTGGLITLDSVRSVVREVITDYDAQVRQKSSAVEQLKASHIAAFKDASEEMPELMDQRSRARQVFDELYSTSPLRALPDGPYQIALQIPGILANEQRRGQAASPERKRQVGVSVPGPSGSDMPDGGLASVKKEFAGLTQQMRSGQQDFKTYKRWRGLRDQIANAQRRG